MGHDVETAGETIMISNRVIFALPIGAIFSALLWQPVVAKVVAPDAKWEQVASGGEGTAEGVVAGKDGAIYFDDLAPPGKIFRFDPKTGKAEILMATSNMANGMHVDRNGDLLMGLGLPGKQMLAKRDMKTGEVTKLVDRYEGKSLISPNDITTDDSGRIYFTDGRFNQIAEPELPNAIYRLDPDGSLTRLATDMGRPNGIEVSPDGKRLYVAITTLAHLKPNPHNTRDEFGITRGGIILYDLDASGSISKGRVFYRTNAAASDGTAMDVDGNLYTAANDRSNGGKEVVALRPDGSVLQQLPLPSAGLPVQLGFGRGDDSSTLYLSTALPWGLWKIKTNVKGFYRN